MNPVVKAQLKAFERANPHTGLPDPDLFEVFAIFSVANGILTDNIDPFSAHLKGTEFGIDGIAIMVQGELCRTADDVAGALASGKNHSVEFNIFQAKSSDKIDYGDLSKFFDGVSTFFDGNFVDVTEQINELIDAKNTIYASALKKNPVLRLFYITTGSAELSKHVIQLIDTNKTRFGEKNIFEAIEIEIIGARELQAGYRSATNSISAKLDISKPITLPDHPSVEQAFLGYVSAEDLVGLATIASSEHGERRINRAVFFDNIRDFNPKSSINISIIEELMNDHRAAESFIFKNNGVTVVARDINRKGDSFEIDDYQIVNGCQTSNILFLAGNKAKGVQVPIRLIGSIDPDFVSSIIVGTNKQNEVKEDQFWALTPFMKNLEEYSREQDEEIRLFIERRENQYRNELIERTRICKPSDLVKAVAAMFLSQPHRAARDYRGIRKEFSSQIFQETHFVPLYHAAAFASYRADFALRNRRINGSWGIYKYYALAAAGQRLGGEHDVFSLKKSKQEAIATAIIELFRDEASLVKHYKEVVSILEKIAGLTHAASRERLRDFLRTESVASQFSQALKKGA
ncbi:AIPR family protein [Kumtagia ephedrae]|uniref:Abortive phage infection protein C-terminal domain-containing protein n=1 Tax=Kumtagia ephedrae TaxID=2116701 RepID=A0A2P7SQZ5_9HYPH|nr:AIPR family protein [Mesorhizobium ephedrae]PSJ64910.1 hypothetical protein C7I84_04595 [Mesorhizobium ephedrae]